MRHDIQFASSIFELQNPIGYIVYICFINHNILAGPLPTGKVDIQSSEQNSAICLFQTSEQDPLEPMIDSLPYLVTVHITFSYLIILVTVIV